LFVVDEKEWTKKISKTPVTSKAMQCNTGTGTRYRYDTDCIFCIKSFGKKKSQK